MSTSNVQHLTCNILSYTLRTLLSITYNTKHLLGCSRLQTSIQLHLNEHELQMSKYRCSKEYNQPRSYSYIQVQILHTISKTHIFLFRFFFLQVNIQRLCSEVVPVIWYFRIYFIFVRFCCQCNIQTSCVRWPKVDGPSLLLPATTTII